MTHELTVSGMTCNHCRASVAQALTQVPGVSHVTVNLATGKATIQAAPEVSVATLVAAVQGQGYSAAAAT